MMEAVYLIIQEKKVVSILKQKIILKKIHIKKKVLTAYITRDVDIKMLKILIKMQ